MLELQKLTGALGHIYQSGEVRSGVLSTDLCLALLEARLTYMKAMSGLNKLPRLLAQLRMADQKLNVPYSRYAPQCSS